MNPILVTYENIGIESLAFGDAENGPNLTLRRPSHLHARLLAVAACMAVAVRVVVAI